MAMSVFSGFVTICLFGIVLAEPRTGACPDIETMPDFEITKFFGRWFEAKRYFKASEKHAKCVTADYALRNDGSIKFVHAQIDTSTGKPSSFEGSLFQPNPNEPGKLTMKFPGLPVMGNYWILGTDYKTYAVIYSCRNVKSSYVQSAWILTRKQNPSESVIKSALAVAVKHNVDTEPFLDTDQTHCIRSKTNGFKFNTVLSPPRGPYLPISLVLKIVFKFGDEDAM